MTLFYNLTIYFFNSCRKSLWFTIVMQSVSSQTHSCQHCKKWNVGPWSLVCLSESVWSAVSDRKRNIIVTLTYWNQKVAMLLHPAKSAYSMKANYRFYISLGSERIRWSLSGKEVIGYVHYLQLVLLLLLLLGLNPNASFLEFWADLGVKMQVKHVKCKSLESCEKLGNMMKVSYRK